MKENAKIGSNVEVQSCFTLSNEVGSITSMMMSICISNTNPRSASTFLHVQEGYSNVRLHTLPFDASKKVAIYRIDYTPCCVNFYVDGILLRTVEASEVMYNALIYV